MRRLLVAVLLVLVGFIGGVVWDKSHEDSTDSGRSRVHLPDISARATSKEVSYANLELSKGDVGWFDGTVDVRNATAEQLTVYVTVHVFSGEQNVGDLTGKVTLKANSVSAADLKSIDDYAPFTDTTVELLPSPAH